MTSKRYRGRKPGHIRRTVWRTICGFGLLLTLGAAGNSDLGMSTAMVVPPLVIGLTLFAVGGYLGELIQ